jgi:APA family basic amino acid/polyamine antiporter
LLFSSFIGFDAIAQAGGEARDPSRTLPLAIGLAIGIVTVFYALFAGAVYHAVPWTVVRNEALRHDTSAAALLGARLPPALRVAVVAGAAVALVKDLPAMLLGVSRLMFAWAEDGIVPRVVASVHPRYHTPQVAIWASATMASLGIVGCHLAGDFFLGVDILVTSMLVNFLLMCGSVLALPRRNPGLARQIRVLRSPGARSVVAVAGIALLGALLVVHTARDLGSSSLPWYLRSTVVWLGVMAVGSAVYWRELRGAAATWHRRAGALRGTAPGVGPVSMASIPRPERRKLAPDLDICRVVTGLWQVADMERGGRQLDLDASARAIGAYVQAGLTTFDMADHYGSAEEIAGRFVAGGGRAEL